MEVYAIYRILVRIRSLKRLWWSLVLLAVFSYGSHEAYLFIDREFFVAKELPFYKVCPRTDDDTLWVAVIGDSWAEFHMTLNSDCSYFWNLFCSRSRDGSLIYQLKQREKQYEYYLKSADNFPSV